MSSSRAVAGVAFHLLQSGHAVGMEDGYGKSSLDFASKAIADYVTPTVHRFRDLVPHGSIAHKHPDIPRFRNNGKLCWFISLWSIFRNYFTTYIVDRVNKNEVEPPEWYEYLNELVILGHRATSSNQVVSVWDLLKILKKVFPQADLQEYQDPAEAIRTLFSPLVPVDSPATKQHIPYFMAFRTNGLCRCAVCNEIDDSPRMSTETTLDLGLNAMDPYSSIELMDLINRASRFQLREREPSCKCKDDPQIVTSTDPKIRMIPSALKELDNLDAAMYPCAILSEDETTYTVDWYISLQSHYGEAYKFADNTMRTVAEDYGAQVREVTDPFGLEGKYEVFMMKEDKKVLQEMWETTNSKGKLRKPEPFSVFQTGFSFSDVLCIRLKRESLDFSVGVIIPTELRLPGGNFKLRGTLHHAGANHSSGHWTSTLRAENGQWIYVDDARIYPRIEFKEQDDGGEIETKSEITDTNEEVVVTSTAGYSESHVIGTRITHKNDVVFLHHIEKGSWAEAHTNLSDYVGWRFLKVNDNWARTKMEFDFAKMALKIGEPVTFKLTNSVKEMVSASATVLFYERETTSTTIIAGQDSWYSKEGFWFYEDTCRNMPSGSAMKMRRDILDRLKEQESKSSDSKSLTDMSSSSTLIVNVDAYEGNSFASNRGPPRVPVDKKEKHGEEEGVSYVSYDKNKSIFAMQCCRVDDDGALAGT